MGREPLKGKEKIWCTEWYDSDNLGSKTKIPIIKGVLQAVEMKKVRDIKSAVEWYRHNSKISLDNKYYQEWYKKKQTKTKYQQRFFPSWKNYIKQKF